MRFACSIDPVGYLAALEMLGRAWAWPYGDGVNPITSARSHGDIIAYTTAQDYIANRATVRYAGGRAA